MYNLVSAIADFRSLGELLFDKMLQWLQSGDDSVENLQAKYIIIIRILEKLRPVDNGRYIIDVVQVLYNVIERQK